MDEELEALMQSLRAGQQAQAGMPLLESQYKAAQQTAAQPMSTSNPLQAISDALRTDRARAEMRELQPQIQQAAQTAATGETGLTEYKLKKSLAKEEADRKAAEEEREHRRKVVEAQMKTKPKYKEAVQYQDAQGNKVNAIFEESSGQYFTAGPEGLQPLDMTGLTPVPTKKSGDGSGKWGTSGERKAFESQAKMMRQQFDVFDNYNKDFSNITEIAGKEIEGLPGVSQMENYIATNAPILSDQESKDKAEWWASYKKFYENLERHELFGSALTAGEQSQWKMSNINESMTDDQIKSRMATLKDLASKVIKMQLDGAKAKGWPDDYVGSQYDWFQQRNGDTEGDTVVRQGGSTGGRSGKVNRQGSGSDGLSDEDLLKQYGGL